MQYKKLFNSFSSFLGIVLFVIAIFYLGREFKQYDPQTIFQDIFSTPAPIILGAILFTILNHTLLIGYDILAFRNSNYPFSLKKTALASFVSFVFGNNIGLSGLGSSAMRLRFFKQWDVPENVTLQVIMFCLLSFWVGIFATAGITFIIAPISTTILPLPSWLNARIIGLLLSLLILVYITSSLWIRKPIAIGSFSLIPPRISIAIIQVVVAVADWVCAAAVLYILLNQGVELPSFPMFVSIFMLALIAGFLSNIPGGLGVFETVIITLLSPTCPTDLLLKSLIIYRFIFFLLPLVVAITLYLIHELLHVGDLVKGLIEFVISISFDLYPGLLSIGTFLLGLILFFTAPVPNGVYLPVELTPIASHLLHLFAALGGFSLMIAAFPIRRRVKSGLIFVIVILPITIGFDLASGMHPETLHFALVIFLFSLLGLRWFPRAGAIQHYPWIVAILAITTTFSGYLWLTTRSSAIVKAFPDFAWQMKTNSQESQVIPLLILFAIIAIGVIIVRVKLKATDLNADIEIPLEQIDPIIAGQSNPYANLVKLRDKQVFFNEKNSAFVMYTVRGRNWIAFGDPIGTPNEARDSARTFIEHAVRNHAIPVFYEVHRDLLDIYLDFGYSMYKIGEEAVVDLTKFTLAGKKFANERNILNSLARKEVTFEVFPAGTADDSLIQELKSISDAWLTGKNVREKRFSLGFFDETYIKQGAIGVVRKSGRSIAFANILLSKESFCADLMRFIPEENDHLMQFLFLNLMKWGQENGYTSFNLGMAPLSGFKNHSSAPIWNRLLWTIFNHGENLYNFKGLRAFKDQFVPQWESVYIAMPRGSIVPLLLLKISAIISGGVRGLVQK